MKAILNSKTALIAATLGAALATATASASTDESVKRFVPSKQLTAVEKTVPNYPRRASRLAIEGQAVVEFTVLPDGSVDAPVVADASHTVFADAVAQAIAGWKFEPVVEAGAAVPVRTAMRFQFTGAD